jgi:RHS repeat-associated protein
VSNRASWDAEDRLTSATVNSVTTTFASNGSFPGRTRLPATGGDTAFIWVAESLMRHVDRSIPQVLDDEDFRYVYGIGRIAQVSGSATHYYLTDGLGSTMALTDADGDVVNDYDYDVFGALRDSSGSQGNDFTFPGEQVDGSTGLQYLRARYYDLATGRFISRDARPGLKWLPQSTNRYVYGTNRPVVLVDPSGYGSVGGACGAMRSTPVSILPTLDTIGGGCGAGPRGVPRGTGITAVGTTLLGGISIFIETLAEQIAALLDSAEGGNYEVHGGKQGKHIPGHNNYIPGRGILTHPDPQGLVDRGAHTGRQIGSVPVGQAGSKELVDFGEDIGTVTGPNGEQIPTSVGVIHYAGDGTVHVVPTRPDGAGADEVE